MKLIILPPEGTFLATRQAWTTAFGAAEIEEVEEAGRIGFWRLDPARGDLILSEGAWRLLGKKGHAR